MPTLIPADKHISYQAQYRRCGKCKDCQAGGVGHGPYLYAYWRENSRMRSASMGKTLKTELVMAYYCQVYQIKGETLDIQSHWNMFKREALGTEIPDSELSQEELKALLVKCKEQVSQRRRQTKADPPEIHCSLTI